MKCSSWWVSVHWESGELCSLPVRRARTSWQSNNISAYLHGAIFDADFLSNTPLFYSVRIHCMCREWRWVYPLPRGFWQMPPTSTAVCAARWLHLNILGKKQKSTNSTAAVNTASAMRVCWICLLSSSLSLFFFNIIFIVFIIILYLLFFMITWTRTFIFLLWRQTG